MIYDCGDPVLGAACVDGRWYGLCGLAGCEGMCQFLGACQCLGCASQNCCRKPNQSNMWAPVMWVYDNRLRQHVLRPIEEGPAL